MSNAESEKDGGGDIVLIELSIKEKKFAQQPNLVAALKRAKEGNGRLHLLGLVSDGGVHSHINHLLEFLNAAKEYGVPKTFVHFFGDGRDTSPKSADKYMKTLLDHIEKMQYDEVATVVGRYYAMDRDERWELVQVAYVAIVQGKGENTTDVLNTISERHAKGETDEFLTPIIVGEEGRIDDGDTLIFINFRSDRMREIAQAFGVPPLPFETVKSPKDIVRIFASVGGRDPDAFGKPGWGKGNARASRRVRPKKFM